MVRVTANLREVPGLSRVTMDLANLRLDRMELLQILSRVTTGQTRALVLSRASVKLEARIETALVSLLLTGISDPFNMY